MTEGTSRTGPISTFVRWAFGVLTVSRQRAGAGAEPSEHESENTPATRPPVQWSHVHIDAAISRQGTAQLNGDFEGYIIYVARQQDQVLVTAGAFDRQDADTGEIQWNSDRDDEESTRDRVALVVKIYDRLSAVGVWHPNIVRFASQHEAGCLLERLHPGLIRCDCGPTSTSDVLLALYQRRALQLMSALSHLHSNGIILNALAADDGLWLHQDYSIAIANFVNA